MFLARYVPSLRQLLPMLLLGFCDSVFAGADPTPTDWLPQFSKVSLVGSDIFFDAGIAEIRLFNGKFSSASSSPINNLVEKQNAYSPKKMACSIPDDVLAKYTNEYKPPEIMYCDLPGKIWFANGGYCGEGDDDPASNQGHLFSYAPASGKVIQYSGLLPKCAELAGLVRINNKLVLTTFYQEEYSQSAGSVLIYDLEQLTIPARVLSNPKPTGAVVGMSAYDKSCDCLWFATETGIERLTISSGIWEQRYFDYEITPDNRLVLTLSPNKPTDKKMWLGRVLFNYPIEDLRGFVKAWKQSAEQEESDSRIRISPMLLPFYISAIERTQDWEKDWTYSGLMRIVESHQDEKSKVVSRAFVGKLLNQPMKLSRKGEVVSLAKRLGLDHAKGLEDAYFDELLIEYFSAYQPDYSHSTNVVRIAFEHPAYLPRLKAFYLSHPTSIWVEKYFLDAAYSYNRWNEYYVVAGAINRGREHSKHTFQLLEMCNTASISRDRGDDLLLAILNARFETDPQAKFTIERKPDPMVGAAEDSCIDASNRWIYGDDAQTRKRVIQMLEAAKLHKELSPIVLEILNKKFLKNFKNLNEWKRWWEMAFVSEIKEN